MESRPLLSKINNRSTDDLTSEVLLLSRVNAEMLGKRWRFLEVSVGANLRSFIEAQCWVKIELNHLLVKTNAETYCWVG